MKFKTINITTPTYFPDVNGLSIVVQYNVKALIELGFNVNVLTNVGGLSLYGEKVYTFNVRGNGRLFNKINGDIEHFKFLLSKLSEGSFLNIYHAWHCWTTNLALETKLTNVFQLVYSHGTGFDTLEPFFYRIFRRILYVGQKKIIDNYMNNLDGMIFISNDHSHPRCYDLINFSKNKYFLNNPIPARNSFNIVSNPIDFNVINHLIISKNKLFINISNFEKIKNQKFLIDLVNSSNQEITLILIGSKNNNYLECLKEYNSSLKNSHRVLFFTGLPDSTISLLLSKSDCFLFASKNDFVPLVLIEANKFGLPFISFYTADINLKGGFFVKNNQEFKNKFNHFCTLDKSHLKELGSEGHSHYLFNNTFDRYKSDLKEIIFDFVSYED